MLPGSYYLAIAGNAGQFAGYGGNLSVAETPIPGAVWLFASGAAGLGALLRRRKKKLATA
jgi:MYXO-CTERM domain-containing protein